MSPTTNLGFWAAAGSYAAGIAVGAKVVRQVVVGASGVGGQATDGALAGFIGGLLPVVVAGIGLTAMAAAVYWFGAKRDPKVVSAYLLIALAFLAVGAVVGARIDLTKVADNPWVANGTGYGAEENPWVANGSGSRVDENTITNDPEDSSAIDFGGKGSINSWRDSGSTASADSGLDSKDAKRISKKAPGGILSWFEEVVFDTRAYVRRVMGERLPKDEAGLMMGVLLGDTSTVPADVKVDFKTTGLSHILAVSGLNITILVTACAFLFTAMLSGLDTPGRVTPGRLVIFGITAGVIVFYMALCGFAPSIVRAGLMGLAALAAPLAGRQTNVFSAMSAAAMAILIIDPAAVFDVGFQLTFAATISIILFAPHVTRWISGTPDAPFGVARALAVTISAQLGVAPILAANFGSLSIITPVANAAVAPAIAPAQLLGIVIPMLNIISEPLAAIAAYPAHLSLAYTMAGASFFAKWPLASIDIPGISQATSTSTAVSFLLVIAAAVYFIALAALYIYLKNRKPRVKFTEVFHGRVLARTILIVAALGVIIIALLGYQTFTAQPPKGLKVTFLDVGQGDSTLIQTEDGATILIDGGPKADSAEAKLRGYGVRQIDLLIITHPHADHVNGLPAVVRDHAIERAIIPPIPSENRQYLRTLELLTNNKVKETAAREGQFYRVGRNLTVMILSPDAPPAVTDANINDAGSEENSEDANNQAVVALIQYKGVKMLFTGDIELDTEEDIIADGEAQKIDILKVPHHGSKNGSGAELMEILKPRFAVISVGAGNRYHHPAPSTLSILRRVGASLFRTDKNGSVTIESDGKTITAASQK